MEGIGQLLKDLKMPEKNTTKARGGINSERADVVAKLLSFMGEDRMTPEETDLEKHRPGEGDAAMKKRIGTRMKYWLGRTRKVDPPEIERLMRDAKDGKNARALFNYLLKNYGKK